ncbi:Iris-A [Operophtera brumata]|uniref:Iris-A n=1 Tax=Operophtera brumata TaxID=104452 RepID=A0A0L7L980_OPEBR|nr:Iris-A [Operophtera brumata]
MNELEHYNNILLGKQFTRTQRTRQPRGLINGVGFLANKLFGVLDQEFAEQYEHDIETIRENEKHLSLLWKNQTSVVEGEFNLIKRVEASIDKQRKVFNQHLNNIEKSLNTQKDDLQLVSNSGDFTLSSVIAQGVLLSLHNIQETIIDSLTNVYAGKFNFHLLTPEQLRDEMTIITGLLSRDMTLPLNNLQSDLSKMYHLLTVKARASNKFIIFEIKIPLVSRDNFELYHLIPIPQQIENRMISLVPISNYVAVNMQKDSYVTITERDLHNCIEFDNDSHLCSLKQPIYQMKLDEHLCVKSQLSNQCQTMTSSCIDSWVELNTINTYLYFCCGQCSVRIICEHQITAEQLHKSGIMTINEECIIKSNALTIYAHKTQSNTLKREADVIKIEIPPINNIINLSIPTSVENKSLYSDQQEYFEEIDRQIKQLKDSASADVLTERLSYHDVHHYVVIYLVLFAGVVIGIAVLVWRRRRAPAPLPGAPAAAPPSLTPPARADIELRATNFEPHAIKCVSESVNQCCVLSEPENQSCSARFSNKASSPVVFRNKFDRTL